MNENAIFAAGCFWGVEEFFTKIKGINTTRVGYSGGIADNPKYEQVCSGITGHAESILINFNSELLTYNSLLNYFWKCHDPTQLNRQELDVGSQYRSAIFYLNQNQMEIAVISKKNILKNYSTPVVTEITKAKTFFDAEDYHQNYLKKLK